MNRISEQIKPFSSWLTPYRKDLVSSCEHLSMTHWVLCFYGPVISHHTLAATLHNMSAFFPPHTVEKAKNMFKQRAIRHPKHACHLILLKQHSCWLPGMWTCRNMITISMHECRAKQTTVERILWSPVVMSTSSNYFHCLRSRCILPTAAAPCLPLGPTKILKPHLIHAMIRSLSNVLRQGNITVSWQLLHPHPRPLPLLSSAAAQSGGLSPFRSLLKTAKELPSAEWVLLIAGQGTPL